MTLEAHEAVFVQSQSTQQTLQVNFSKYHLGSQMISREDEGLTNINIEEPQADQVRS